MNAIINKLILVFTLTLTACFSGNPIPQDNYYRLSEPVAVNVHIDSVTTISISPFSSDAVHRDRAIIYSDINSPSQLNKYHYHYWIYAPNQLLQEQLIATFKNPQSSLVIVRGSGQRNIDLYIVGHIIQFERVTGGSETKVRVQVELTARDHRGEQLRVLQKNYTKEITAVNKSMLATVDAFSMAVNAIYMEFIADLKSWSL